MHLFSQHSTDNARDSIRLVLDRVTAYRGRHQVLAEADLVAEGKQVTCLIGPSGAGKTTLLKCANLLISITGGRILLADQPVVEVQQCNTIAAPWRRRLRSLLWDSQDDDSVVRQFHVHEDQYRRTVGMVFQDYGLFERLTVLGNLIEAPTFVYKEPRAQATDRAIDLLKKLGLSRFIDRRPSQLSGGQRQRAAIARALMMDPKVLLLDEVTSALDPELAAEVLDLIRELATQGRTILMVTHHLDLVRQIGHSVVMLDNGSVIENGPPEQVLDSPSHPRTKAFIQRLQSVR